MERLLIPSYPLDFIDKSNLEIKQDEDGTVYKDLESIGDDLPDHSPRFILLSYPCTLVYHPFPSFLPIKSCPTLALRPSLRPICPHLLPPTYSQCRAANVICWGQGADEEYCGGFESPGN